jgi:hypothetical protein
LENLEQLMTTIPFKILKLKYSKQKERRVVELFIVVWFHGEEFSPMSAVVVVKNGSYVCCLW